MTTTTVAFFNNKGGVGKTSLVYHLVWKYADMGRRVIAADLDPQANLTSSFLEEERLEEIWDENSPNTTIYECLRPLIGGTGDIADPKLQILAGNIGLIVGHLALSGFEDQLSEVWPKCLDGDERAFRVTSAFWRVMQKAAEMHEAELIMIDLGPNLGAINRAALISADYVVLPLGPDLYSLQGLKNLGPKLRVWRQGWKARVLKNPVQELRLPPGQIHPLGYVVMQHSVRLDRPVKSYDRWIAKIPSTYRTTLLHEHSETQRTVEHDPYCLAMLKHYRSLMPMAQENHKPMFHLQSADGAIGAHQSAAVGAGRDFGELAKKIDAKIVKHKGEVAIRDER